MIVSTPKILLLALEIEKTSEYFLIKVNSMHKNANISYEYVLQGLALNLFAK